MAGFLAAEGCEFVALPVIEGIMGRAREPKRLWVVEASNHRFSDNQA